MYKNFIYLLVLFSSLSYGNVIVPAIFSDHMVLQQNEDVKFWGWASPNEEVQINPSWTEEVYKVKATSSAKWELKVKTPKAGGPYTIGISGFNEIIINDVIIGEVWLCSGQSNMEMSASWGIKNGDNEIKKANHPSIRFFKVEKSSADYPQDHIMGKWEVCTPEIMKDNSAVAYYFALKLQDNLKNTPVGLIISAWGGTPAEIWMPEVAVSSNKAIASAADNHKPQEWGPIKPAKAFNAMIYPIIRYNITGTLWYQGESNIGSLVYEQTLEALIKSWRSLWQDDFPFYFVQIAPYNDGFKHFGGVQIRDAQRKVANTVENTGMVVISDISPTNNIHPKNKKPVGIRLANLALKKHYKVIDGLIESPNFNKVNFKRKTAKVYFNNFDGLYMKGNKSLFEIAGADKFFYEAKIKIKEDHVLVSSQQVRIPKYIRFAWGNFSQSNIFNKANLPASSFTTE